MRSLVDELNSLSMKNDELMAQREQDAEGMDEMEAKVLEYKKKYDSIRIELRNLKGKSPVEHERGKALTISHVYYVHLQAAIR
jgi:archaellum component FlaC